MSKIIGNTTATPNPRPDWNQTDETKADYIKNKTVVDDHIKSTNNPHKITKTQIGLKNVDNTSDANKPISTATQNALDAITDALDIVVANVEANTESINKNVGCSASGELISLTDSENTKIRGMKIFGKTKQFTTTGKNLFNISSDTRFTKQSDGSYINTEQIGTKKIPLSLPHGTYTVSYDLSCPTGANGRLSIGLQDGTRVEVYKTSNGSFIHTETTFTGEVVDWCIVYSVIPGVETTTIKNIQLELGSAPTEYEPYTGGIPSPNPNYPQELVSVGDSGSTTEYVTGKNLISDEVYDYNNWVAYEGHSGRYYWLNLPEGAYTVSANSTGKNNYFYIYKMINGTPMSTNTHTLLFDGKDSGSYTFTVAKGDVYGFWTNAPYLPNVFDIQLEAGSVATPYEPYKEQSLTIPTPNGLPGIPVSSSSTGNYIDENGQKWVCDEVDFERGVYIKNISSCTFDNNTVIAKTEACDTSQGCSEEERIIYIIGPANMKRQGSLSNSIISTHYVANGNRVWYGLANAIYISGNNFLIHHFGMTTKELYKEWLSSNPVTVYYELAEPIETPLTEEELQAYKALHANYPNTTIYNSDGAGAEVGYVAIGALPSSTTLADIPDDPKHRTVTDEEKAIWNNAFNINAKVNNGVLVLSQSVN